MRFLSPSPFVLVCGDQESFLYGPGNNLRLTERSPAARLQLQTLLRQDPKRPVLILLDSLSLALTSTDLPAIGRRDKNNLLKHRLADFFPDAIFRTARLQMPQRALLIAVHASEMLRFWQETLAETPNPSCGLALLPLAAPMVIKKFAPGKGWKLLLSLERSGGCRQTVLRDGCVVFTRLTPLPITQTSSTFAAALLACDLQATRTYLSRFGLLPETNLGLIAFLPSELHAPLAAAAKDTAQGAFFTPAEAAKKLGLPSEAEHPHFCDGLFAALVSNPLPPLRFFTEREQQMQRERFWRRSGLSVFWFCTLMLLFFMANDVMRFVALRQEEAALQQAVHTTQTERSETLRAGSREDETFRRAQTVLAQQRIFQAPAPTPWALLDRIAPALATDPKLYRLSWQSNGATQTLHLTVRFAESLEQSPAERAEALRTRWNDQTCHAVLTRAPTEQLSTASSDVNAQQREADFDVMCEDRP